LTSIIRREYRPTYQNLSFKADGELRDLLRWVCLFFWLQVEEHHVRTTAGGCAAAGIRDAGQSGGNDHFGWASQKDESIWN